MADVAKLKTNEPFSVEELLKLANTIDQFERYNRPHASRMAQLAELIALRIGISGADLNAVKFAALLHDIGELIMDAPAIRAEGYLDFRRRIELWRHPVIGEQQAAKRGLPRQVQLLIRWHHEWWNGAGYPDMLAGAAIPIGARILRLTDTYDSLTASRPYREAFEEPQARALIAASAGIEFDPIVVRIFFDIMEELDRRAEEERARNAAAAALAAAAAETLAAEIPAEEAPVAEILVEEVLVEEIPAEEAPAVEIPVEEIPVEEIPVEEVFIEEAPAEISISPLPEPALEVIVREIIVEPIVEPTVEPTLGHCEESEEKKIDLEEDDEHRTRQ